MAEADAVILAEATVSYYPLFVMLLGMAVVIGMILSFRINAFIALITAALVVSFLSPGDFPVKVSRVAEAFGTTAGQIGIVIALAAVIGQCMMESGAADRIVRAFLRLLGEKRAATALMGSGFVLAVPVFFDTVFYLLVPLARSLYQRTQKNFLLYVMAIGAGGAITHTLVPPTPGPYVMAETLGVDIGYMILIGALVAIPSAVAGVLFAKFMDARMPIPARKLPGREDPEPLTESELPPLLLALLPVVLPVLMISSHTIVQHLAKTEARAAAESLVAEETPAAEGEAAAEPKLGPYGRAARITAVVGNPNLALLVSATMALLLYYRQRRPAVVELAAMVEHALMSGGVIILITAAGGAFGAMLKAAEVGITIETIFKGQEVSGMTFLLLGFGVAVLLKISQGSSTVAMITVSGMLAAMIEGHPPKFNPVYLATAIGAGSLVGSWMNDSGFWVFAKMSGLTEAEALKSWTPMLVVLGFTSLATTIVLALLLPLK